MWACRWALGSRDWTKKINSDAPVCIHAGPYTATLDPHGATLRTLTFDEHPLVVDNPDPAAAAGAILAPWPNRTADGHFTWDGTAYQLEINEPDRSNAIHGLLRDKQWEVLERTETRCVFGVTLQQQPWHIRWEAHYTLHPETGLDLQLQAHNLGQSSCPIGVGFHPYLTAWGTPLAESYFTIALTERIELDRTRLLPTGQRYPHTPFQEESMAMIELDGCFEVQLGVGGKTRARLTNKAGNGVEIRSSHLYFQVYAGGCGLAVEPQTCPPNMLQTGAGRVELNAETSATFGYGLRAIFLDRGWQG